MTERPHKTIGLARPHDGGAIFQVHDTAFPTPAEARIAAALDGVVGRVRYPVAFGVN
jgi:hypothetical protein